MELLRDFFLRKRDKSCDVFRTVQELVESRGFSFEEHKVTTGDGYFLTLHRIANLQFRNHNNQLKPVLLNHGLAECSTFFLINSKEDVLKKDKTSNSLAFALAKLGHDVWLGNFRGNR